MKLTGEAWTFKNENFGELLPYVLEENITDINYNGEDVWIEDLKKGRYKAPIHLTANFVEQFCTRVANMVSQQFNGVNNVLEAETDTLRISNIHSSVTNTGYSISIRKTPAVMRMTEAEMLQTNYCTQEVLNFLKNCIKAKISMCFCGTPGAGKTELLKFLTQFIPQEERVITIEDTWEIHYRELNPDSNCVELKVDNEIFTYTKAIKTVLRQNPDWVLLSEARSVEVKYLLECLSTGIHVLTTIHTDDTNKIPDRVKNMLPDAYVASNKENDIYSFLNVGVLIRKRVIDGKIVRTVEQISLFDRDEDENRTYLMYDSGKMIADKIPLNLLRKFKREGICDPFTYEC